MTRTEVLDTLAATIASLAPRSAAPGVLRIAIDGVDGAGKTVFADALARVLRGRGRDVIRASVDGFHQPRAVRYRRGRESPLGFFVDSYDYSALRAHLLDPLGPGGKGSFRTAAFDHRADAPVDGPVRHATPGAVLVFDGIFLHRAELVSARDYSVFLRVGFAETCRRMAIRDGCPPEPEDDANRRYVEGQRLYLSRCTPEEHASVVIDNTDPANPRVTGAILTGVEVDYLDLHCAAHRQQAAVGQLVQHWGHRWLGPPRESGLVKQVALTTHAASGLAVLAERVRSDREDRRS